MTSTDPNVRRRRKLAADLRGLHNVTLALGKEAFEAHGGVGCPGSPMEVEKMNTEAGPAGPWGAQPVRTTYSSAALLSIAVQDHMLGLADSIDGDEITLLTSTLLLRAELEATTRLWRLLEPGIDVRERVRRGSTEAILASQEDAEIGRAGGSSDADKGLNALTAMIEGWGFTLVRDRRRGHIVGVDKREPSMTKLSQAMLEEEGLDLRLYPFLSAVAHSRLNGLLEFVDLVPNNDGDLFAEPRLTVEHVEGCVRVAEVAYVAAMRRMGLAVGWCVSDLDSFVVAMRRRMWGS